MKILPSISSRGRAANQAFTLPEVIIALTIFLLLLGGILFANLFGLKMFQATNTKLNVSTWSRQTIEKLTDEVRNCNNAQIVIVSNGTYSTLLDGDTQQGSGLLINPSTNASSYILYFYNAADQTLRRTTDQPGSAVILASSITNTQPFSAQDLLGNVLTNNVNNRVIHVILQFYQPERFLQRADYFKLETSVKQRIVP